MVAPVLAWLKKPWAERTAANNPVAAAYSPIDELDKETFVHLGAGSSPTEASWEKILKLFNHRLVRSEPFSKAHVTEWLDLPDTQSRIQRLAHARITAAAEPLDDRLALIHSYIEASGEHCKLAEDFVDHTVKVLVAGIRGAVRDVALGAQLQISVRALQQRFDDILSRLDNEVAPESGWSLGVAYKANSEWLLNTFSSRNKAKIRFGQPLSPADAKTSVIPMSRVELTERLEALLKESPHGGVVALTGDEGNGKSWLVAQTWLSLPAKPLTLFLTAEDVTEVLADPVSLFSHKLCEQTDRQGFKRHQEFWSAQLRSWRTHRCGPEQGFLVVLDGLNQRPRTEWARLIDRLGEELERIGGRLIITSRKRYFDGVVKPRLVSPCRELPVPEWTPAERDSLLTTRGMHGGQLHERVAASLCNPRLLSIALTLLDSERLRAMEELSIPLLLFEHLRVSQRETYGQSAEHFKRNLQDHAKKVLQRLDSKQFEDLKVFEGGLDAVVEGRFFIPLSEDLTLYTVREEGLGLALGLAILDELRTAQRNGRDLSETLAVLAEPIAALDQTSEAILAALTIACMSEETSTEIGVAILVSFASLQNLDDYAFDAISALARSQTEVFLEGAQNLALQGGRAINFDWIVLALHQAKADKQAWQTIASAIKGWLAHVTLKVEQHILPYERSADEVTQQCAKMQGELEAKLLSLSAEERAILASLEHTTAHDVSVLGKMALKLLAGMPLAQFALAFVQWSFARSLNGNHEAPIKEFRQLIRFNGVDWEATRSALLLSSQMLRDGATSHAGQWALVSLLQVTGHPDDARAAQELVNVLREGQPKSFRWRQIEDYCTVDPCDPNNAEPNNVVRTAEQYASIDVSKLYLHMGMDMLDRFFSDARPAISRYRLEIAVERHRAWIDDILHRSGLPLRQGVVGLLTHSALVTQEQAQKFVRRVCGSDADSAAVNSLGEEADIWAQFQLQLAFPVLEPPAQLDALMQARFGNRLSLNLIELIKPLDIQSFEVSLVEAVRAKDDEAQFTVLLFAPFENQPISPVVREHLTALLRSDSSLVRAHALRMIWKSGDIEALRLVANSGWSTAQLNADEKHERWYGCELLLEAVVQGVVPWEKAVAKLDFQHLGHLARRLGGPPAQHVACVVDALLRHSLEIPVETGMLEIELLQRPGDIPRPQYFRLHETEVLPANSAEAWQRAFKQDDDFEERQRNLHAAFDALLEHLTRNSAEKLLDQLRMEDFDAIVAADTSLAERWCNLLLNQPNHLRLGAVRNISLLLARSIAARDPTHAVQLFGKFDRVDPLVRVVFGQAAIELSSMAVWSTTDHPELDALRERRLDHAPTNDILAREVWAALWNDKSTQLQRYIDTRLTSTWPAAQARAILVAGLMGQNPHSDRVLARFAGVPGMLGETQCVAQEAYDRHAWTVHWFNAMRNASSVEAFWQAAVLFLVVSDGRVEALSFAQESAPTNFRLHWPNIECQLHNRFDKLRKKYKERLLAEEAPWTPFLMPLELN